MAKKFYSIYLQKDRARLALLKPIGKRIKIERLTSCSIHELENFIRTLSLPFFVTFYSKEAFYETGGFPWSKPTFMELRIKKKIADTGVLLGDYLLRYKVLERRENLADVGYLAMPLEERDMTLKHLAPTENLILGLYPLQCSLAALLSVWTKELAMGVYPIPQGYEVFFFKESTVLYSRAINTATVEDPQSHLLNSVQDTIKFFVQTHKSEPDLLYVFEQNALNSLKNQTDVPISFPHISELVKDYDAGEDVSDLAPVIGNLFVPKTFNLLDPSYMAEITASTWSRYIYRIVGVLSLAILAMSTWQGIELAKLRREYTKTYEQTVEEVASIVEVQPTEEKLAKVRKFITFYQAFQKQPKLSNFFIWLSTHSPPRSTITTLKATPLLPKQEVATPTYSTSQHPAANEESPAQTESFLETTKLSILIKGTLTGDYQDVRRDFYRFIADLNRMCTIKNSWLDYKELKGSFSVEVEYGEKDEKI